MEANQPEIAVTTGLKAFLKAWLNNTFLGPRPLAIAVLIYSWLYTSSKELRISCETTAKGRIPSTVAGSIKFFNLSWLA